MADIIDLQIESNRLQTSMIVQALGNWSRVARTMGSAHVPQTEIDSLLERYLQLNAELVRLSSRKTRLEVPNWSL